MSAALLSVETYGRCSGSLLPASAPKRFNSSRNRQFGGVRMGKYFLAWLLGVPATVLVVVYLIMHV